MVFVKYKYEKESTFTPKGVKITPKGFAKTNTLVLISQPIVKCNFNSLFGIIIICDNTW